MLLKLRIQGRPGVAVLLSPAPDTKNGVLGARAGRTQPIRLVDGTLVGTPAFRRVRSAAYRDFVRPVPQLLKTAGRVERPITRYCCHQGRRLPEQSRVLQVAPSNGGALGLLDRRSTASLDSPRYFPGVVMMRNSRQPANSPPFNGGRGLKWSAAPNCPAVPAHSPSRQDTFYAMRPGQPAMTARARHPAFMALPLIGRVGDYAADQTARPTNAISSVFAR